MVTEVWRDWLGVFRASVPVTWNDSEADWRMAHDALRVAMTEHYAAVAEREVTIAPFAAVFERITLHGTATYRADFTTDRIFTEASHRDSLPNN